MSSNVSTSIRDTTRMDIVDLNYPELGEDTEEAVARRNCRLNYPNANPLRATCGDCKKPVTLAYICTYGCYHYSCLLKGMRRHYLSSRDGLALRFSQDTRFSSPKYFYCVFSLPERLPAVFPPYAKKIFTRAGIPKIRVYGRSHEQCVKNCLAFLSLPK